MRDAPRRLTLEEFSRNWQQYGKTPLYWRLSVPMITRMPLPERLRMYRELVQAADFPDLASAVQDFTRRRYPIWLAAEIADLPRQLRRREVAKGVKRWNMVRAKVPPGPCVYCHTPGARHVDHVIPRMHGGTDDLSNLARACIRCNSQKNDRTPEQWRAWRDARGLPWPPAWENKGAA